MESIKPYLDKLPKRGFDWLKENYQEGDRIYKYSGNSGSYGPINVIMVGRGTHCGLAFFYEDLQTGKITEQPTYLVLVFYAMEEFERVRQKSNSERCPLGIKDQDQRRLAIQIGEVITRYKLLRKNGEELEILL